MKPQEFENIVRAKALVVNLAPEPVVELAPVLEAMDIDSLDHQYQNMLDEGWFDQASDAENDAKVAGRRNFLKTVGTGLAGAGLAAAGLGASQNAQAGNVPEIKMQDARHGTVAYQGKNIPITLNDTTRAMGVPAKATLNGQPVNIYVGLDGARAWIAPREMPRMGESMMAGGMEAYAMEDEQLDGMALGELKAIAQAAKKIYRSVKQGVPLEAWMYKKITNGNEGLTAVAQQIDNPAVREQQGVAEGSDSYTVANDPDKPGMYSYREIGHALQSGHSDHAKIYKNNKFLSTVGDARKSGVAEGFTSGEWDNDKMYRSIINKELRLAKTDPKRAAMNLLQGETQDYPLIANAWNKVDTTQDLLNQAKQFFEILQTNLVQQGVAEGSSQSQLQPGTQVMLWLGPKDMLPNPPRDDKRYWDRGVVVSEPEMMTGSWQVLVKSQRKGQSPISPERVFVLKQQGVAEGYDPVELDWSRWSDALYPDGDGAYALELVGADADTIRNILTYVKQNRQVLGQGVGDTRINNDKTVKDAIIDIRKAYPQLYQAAQQPQGVAEARRDAYQRDYDRSVAGMDAGPLGYEKEWDEEPVAPTYRVYVSDGTTWHREGSVYDHEMAAQRYIHQQVFPKNPQARVGIVGPGDTKPVVVPPIKGHTYKETVGEGWSQKYKSSINCSHPRGFSQKAHCAGKKKHTESHEVMEMTCPDCGMCQTHGNLNEIRKGQKDSNGFTKCWPNKHAEGTKKGKNGGWVRKCVPNESTEQDPNDPQWSKKYSKDIGESTDYAAQVNAMLNEFAGSMGVSSVAVGPSAMKNSAKTGTLFGGSYNQKNSPFKKKRTKKESMIKRDGL